jgi:hypothetical protein
MYIVLAALSRFGTVASTNNHVCRLYPQAHYPELLKDVRIRVIELMDYVLSTYDRKIGEFTHKQFERAGGRFGVIILRCTGLYISLVLQHGFQCSSNTVYRVKPPASHHHVSMHGCAQCKMQVSSAPIHLPASTCFKQAAYILAVC